MKKIIGAQFFTIREFINTPEDFDESCRKVAEMGYKTVQISGTGLPAKVMKPILDKYGLPCVGTHRSIDDFTNNIDAVIEYNKILESPIAGISMMHVQTAESVDGIMDFCNKVNSWSERLRKEGLKLGYHNHAFEFTKLNNKTVYDYIIENTDCSFICDTYWYQVGGQDPAKMLRKLGKRAELIHFKDYKVTLEDWRKGCITEIGNGNLDWDEIIKVCDEIGGPSIVVEQDTCDKDPFESLKISIDYLAAKGFEK